MGSIGNLRQSGYYGVCFLLDECEKLVGEAWWKDDASAVLRSYLDAPSDNEACRVRLDRLPGLA